MQMIKIKMTLVFFVNFFIINNLIFGMKLSEISGIEKLVDYNKIKNIEVERVIEKKAGTSGPLSRKENILYVNGEKDKFTGAVISRENNYITAIYTYINGKNNGIGIQYYKNGKIDSTKIYKNDIPIEITDYYENGNIRQSYKQMEEMKRGVKITYYKDKNKISSKQEVILDDSKVKVVDYIKNGKTTVYEKNGNILGELNFNNGSLLGERQKLYKNGKVKYDFIGGAKDIKDLKAIRSYIEYFDNSDTMKYSCNEVSTGNWKCKEYSKDGSFKQEVDGRKYVSVNNNHHGNIWVNIFLGAWNILNP